MPLRISTLFVLCSVILLISACNDAGETAGEADMRASVQTAGCHGPEDCEESELCVATEAASESATCVARCSIEDGDVCPVGEYCAKVIGMQGDHAAACIEGTVESQQSWQRCTTHDECSDGEGCVDLDEVLGARCIPSCDIDETCVNADEECALHWDGEHGPQSGCVRQCESDLDCGAEWRCMRGASVSGICVR